VSKLLAIVFNAACNLFFCLAVRFGSKAWGGVDGAYRHGRQMRWVEFAAWTKANHKAVTSPRFGDLDDSALAVMSGNQRYELEEWSIENQLRSVQNSLREIDVTPMSILSIRDLNSLSQAKSILSNVLYILENGRPKPLE
jgi:hypothetical protein